MKNDDMTEEEKEKYEQHLYWRNKVYAEEFYNYIDRIIHKRYRELHPAEDPKSKELRHKLVDAISKAFKDIDHYQRIRVLVFFLEKYVEEVYPEIEEDIERYKQQEQFGFYDSK